MTKKISGLEMEIARSKRPPTTSRNSSQPPSRDFKTEKKKRTRSRKKGAKPGHEKQERQLVEYPNKVKDDDDPYERNNRWAFYSALTRGIDKVRLIAVWDGKGETPRDRDARLVKHMIDLMRETSGIIEHINSVKLTSTAVAANPDSLPDSSRSAPKSTSRKRSKSGPNGSKHTTSKKWPAD